MKHEPVMRVTVPRPEPQAVEQLSRALEAGMSMKK